MQTSAQKKSLNLIIDRMATLKYIRWNDVKAVVEIDFDIKFFEQPEDTGDDWPISYIFRLSSVRQIFISPHTAKIPSEIASGSPSVELVQFLLTMFENQGIYEWTTFADPYRRFSLGWKNGWKYTTPEFSPDLDFACIFKERGDLLGGTSSVWVAGFWFSKLEIIALGRVKQPIEIEAFINRFRPYAERIQG